MSKDDKTKAVLQDALAELFRQQTVKALSGGNRGSYLVAQDGQFLGNITKNRYDNLSILNRYGPHGSRYSQTCIFNRYSPYVSRYGAFSMNNPHGVQPPKVVLKDKLAGFLTVNSRVKNAIDPELFINLLENDIDALLRGDFRPPIPDSVRLFDGLFIRAADGTFLGSLSTNALDQKSIFNKLGPHGSQFSGTSIFNQFGPYGGQFSTHSPFNQFSSAPPVIMRGDEVIAYLTKNRFLSPRIDPDQIRVFAAQNR